MHSECTIHLNFNFITGDLCVGFFYHWCFSSLLFPFLIFPPFLLHFHVCDYVRHLYCGSCWLQIREGAFVDPERRSKKVASARRTKTMPRFLYNRPSRSHFLSSSKQNILQMYSKFRGKGKLNYDSKCPTRHPLKTYFLDLLQVLCYVQICQFGTLTIQIRQT